MPGRDQYSGAGRLECHPEHRVPCGPMFTRVIEEFPLHRYQTSHDTGEIGQYPGKIIQDMDSHFLFICLLVALILPLISSPLPLSLPLSLPLPLSVVVPHVSESQ